MALGRALEPHENKELAQGLHVHGLSSPQHVQSAGALTLLEIVAEKPRAGVVAAPVRVPHVVAAWNG